MRFPFSSFALTACLLAIARLAVCDPPSTKSDRIAPLWADLAGVDAAKAYRAIWALVQSPKETIPFLRERLQQLTAPPPQQVTRWLADLQSKQFKVRDRAAREMEPVVELAAAALRKAHAGSTSLEMKRRLQLLLQTAEEPGRSSLQRQRSRAVEVLELVGSAEARGLLQRLAGGVPEALLTRRAKDAVARLERRAKATRPLTIGPPAPRFDLFGDSLPPGARARLGTVQFREAEIAAFSPDGKVIATCSYNWLVLWDAATGKEVRRIPFGGDRPISMLFSADGKRIAVRRQGILKVEVWNAATGKSISRFGVNEKRGYTDQRTNTMALSENGKLLYAGDDLSMHVWDVDKGKEMRQFRIPRGKDEWDGNNIVVVSPCGRFVLAASAGDEGTAQVWAVSSGKRLYGLQGHKRGITAAAFSRDGKILATGSFDQTVRLWDAATGKALRNLGKHSGYIVAIAFSPDGTKLAVGADPVNWGNTVQPLYLWDLAAPNQTPRRVAAPGISQIFFAPDGHTVAWVSCCQSVARVDWATGKEVHACESHRGEIFTVAYSSNGQLVATGSRDYTIRLWDANTARAVRTLAGHKDKVNAVAFSPDGNLLASASQDLTAALWDIRRRKKLFDLKGHDSHVLAVAFSPDGKLLASGCFDGKVRLWDPQTGKELRCIEGFRDTYSLAFSPDGKSLACADLHSVSLRDVVSGRELKKWATASLVTWVAFSPDGCTVAAASPSSYRDKSRNTIHLWEVLTGQERANFPGFSNWAGSVAFSPDGRLLATGGNDPAWDMNRVIRVYDLATGKELPGFRGHLGHVRAVAFSPDGSSLATASDDATALVWDVPPHGASATPRRR